MASASACTGISAPFHPQTDYLSGNKFFYPRLLLIDDVLHTKSKSHALLAHAFFFFCILHMLSKAGVIDPWHGVNKQSDREGVLQWQALSACAGVHRALAVGPSQRKRQWTGPAFGMGQIGTVNTEELK